MVFLGSGKTDKANRITLIKEVAEILELKEKDHVMFYLENGEIIVRKYLPVNPTNPNPTAEFDEWARKREIEISLIDDPDLAEQLTKELNEKKGDIEEIIKSS